MANGEHVAKGRRFSDKPKWPNGCSLCQCIVVSTVTTDVCLIESKSSSFTLDQWLVCTSIHWGNWVIWRSGLHDFTWIRGGQEHEWCLFISWSLLSVYAELGWFGKWQHGLDTVHMQNKPLIIHMYMYTSRIKSFVYAQVHIYICYDLMQLIHTSSIGINHY